MANLDRIGIYLTDQVIVLTNSNRNKLQRVLSAPLNSILSPPKDASFSSEATDEVQIVSHIQKVFRDEKINPGQVCVSIPIEEIFLRSFVMPWMTSSELNNAVFYEAKKYLPFDLKLLDYMYQPVVQIEGNQKRWRIIFYAVRKQTLEKYERIIKQIGGKPFIFEPALVSLAKHLVFKKYLRIDQSTVVVYINKQDVHIVFYEKGIAYFVRDFVLSAVEGHDPNAASDAARAQLIREVRKSFGYYNSQFSQEKIKEVLILTDIPDPELTRILTEELTVKVRVEDPSVSVGLQRHLGMDSLCAWGSCLDKVSSKFNAFNFLESKASSQAGGFSPSTIAFDLSQMLGLTKEDFKPAIIAVLLCSLLLGGSFYIGQQKLDVVKKQNEKMAKTDKDFLNFSVEQLKLEIKTDKDKIDNYEKIQSQSTHMAPMVVILTRAIPPGIWLQEAKITNLSNNRVSLELTGYIYVKDKGVEYRKVSEFLNNLRESKYFSDLTFSSTSPQKKELDGQAVSTFTITGS